MTPELERAVERYRQWFGSYKKSGELIKVQVWLTVNNGCIEFLSLDDSYKVKRLRRNPRVICYIGDKEGPQIAGTAEIVMGRDALWRVYRAYWKTHPLVMAVIALPIRRRIKTRKQVLIRVRPDEPNPRILYFDPKPLLLSGQILGLSKTHYAALNLTTRMLPYRPIVA